MALIPTIKRGTLHRGMTKIEGVRVLVVHYSLGFTAYKAVSGGVFFRCGTPKDVV